MKRTYEEKSHQPINSVKPTTLNLQPRGFASPQAELAEDVSSQTNKVSSENLLEKLISTPISESSTTPIQRKPQNRLKAMRSQQMEIQAKQNDESSVESNLASIHGKPQNRLKAIISKGTAIQAKLNIGEPNDKYEKEADDTASKVVQQINSPTQDKSVQKQESMEEDDELQMKLISSIQREESMEEDEELQMKSLVQKRENFGGGEASTDLESSIQSARGSGQSLDTGLQAKMGQAMGADFSGVKVHTDSQSDQLNKSIQAKAFTTGQDVFFRQGSYEPSSRSGQELIAHELTHVVQQTGQKAIPIQRKENQVKAAFAARDMVTQARLNIGELNDQHEEDAGNAIQQINSTRLDQSIQCNSFPEKEKMQMKPIVNRLENISGGEVIQCKITMKGAGTAKRTDGSAKQLEGEVNDTLNRGGTTEKLEDRTNLQVSITNRNDENGKILAKEGKTEKWESHKWRIDKEKEFRGWL